MSSNDSADDPKAETAVRGQFPVASFVIDYSNSETRWREDRVILGWVIGALGIGMAVENVDRSPLSRAAMGYTLLVIWMAVSALLNQGLMFFQEHRDAYKRQNAGDE